jgi:ketosteroid isomerase-like protein
MVKAGDPRSAVLRFNAAINAQDLDGLAALMTADHAFIDAAGGRVSGKQAVVDTWRGFFRSFPDYRNHFDRVVARGGTVLVEGHSTCSDQRLSGPALWAATVVGGLVAEWRVYDDAPANRRRLGIDGQIKPA